jgi:hypothetical protein
MDLHAIWLTGPDLQNVFWGVNRFSGPSCPDVKAVGSKIDRGVQVGVDVDLLAADLEGYHVHVSVPQFER